MVYCSDIEARQFAVDNQKAQGKGFIPGFEAGIMLFALILVISFGFGRRRVIRGDLR